MSDINKDKLIVVYITGQVWQPNLSYKAGPTHVESVSSMDDIPRLLRRYDVIEGVCAQFDVRVVL